MAMRYCPARQAEKGGVMNQMHLSDKLAAGQGKIITEEDLRRVK
jgi:hypothetical protein